MQLNKLNSVNKLEAYSEIDLSEQEINGALARAQENKLRSLKLKQMRESTEDKPFIISEEDLELTNEEKEYSFMRARQEKYGKLKQQEYIKGLYNAPIYKIHTLETLKEAFLSWKTDDGDPYTLDQNNTDIFNTLSKYFLKDETCELNLNKGIYLFGNVGCGKTSMMDFFKYNQTDSYIIASCRDITYNYSKHGDEALKRYNSPIPFVDSHLSYGQRLLGVCFDDLGTEDDRKHFGNQSNVMADIFLNRYDNKQNLIRKTHFTSNLSVAEIEDRYGTRVKSRMREMFNLVSYPSLATDRRK